MIFVTVGTHEQPFNRLIKEVDTLKKNGVIEEDVVMQIGFSTYEPEYCKWSRFLTNSKMEQYMEKSRIVITHGGPATFMSVVSKGKVPIVVPRLKKYNEHVNDHQLEFVRAVQMKFGNILLVEEISKLSYFLLENTQCSVSKSTNEEFCKKFSLLVNELFKEKK